MKGIQLLNGFPLFMELAENWNKDGLMFLAIHMDPVCNFRCKKCFIGSMKSMDNKNNLTIKEIETILKSGRDSGARVFGITGAGEPLLDKKLLATIELADRLGFITHLATNASLLTKERIEFIRDHNVTLVISLDTSDPKKFSELTGTSQDMFKKVKENIILAQQLFHGTKNIMTIDKDNEKIELQVFRLAIHATINMDNFVEISNIKSIIDPEVTLFSVSPTAFIGSAEDNKLNIPKEFERELSERHIVTVKDPKTGNDICGFFLAGIDINFDGELLLDAHAIESRGLISNIRDFNFDVEKAFEHLNNFKKDFKERFLEGFCPVRSPKLKEFLEENVELKKKIVDTYQKERIPDKICI